MVMRVKRMPNETWLCWVDKCLVSGRYPGPRWARIIRGAILFMRRWDSRIGRWRIGRRKLGQYRDRDLIYAGSVRCVGCGAGMAYPRNAGMHGEWDCSAVLKGLVPPTKEHPTYPFVFYEINSEDQPSMNGRTTRPGVRSVRYGAVRNKFIRR